MSEPYGDGHGDGYGGGGGYGYGYGDGYGDGDGDGDGEKIGCVANHDIYLLRPWQYVAVGCECHSITWWQKNWRTVANHHGISITKSELEELSCKVTSYVVGRTAVL